MEKVQSGNLDLLEKNRKVLQDRYPEVWACCERAKTGKVKTVCRDGSLVNLQVDGVNLYPENIDAWLSTQLSDYFVKPDRIGFDNPKYCNLSPIAKSLLDEIKEYFENSYHGELTKYPHVDSGFCFVFGVALGLHIRPLIERTEAKVVVLIEPQPALLWASFESVDWSEILTVAETYGAELRFVVGSSPADVVHYIERSVWDDGQTFLEGSYAFIHYPSWDLLESRKLLNEKLPASYISSGFYEDELLMMANTYGNLKRYPLKFVERRPKVERNYPVFIVGSGPSLDKDIQVVKKWRNKALVFSCGTSSLGILLKNGIVPDFHGENENSWPLVENLRRFAKEYDLSPITYIASTSVNPKAAELFEKRWFYYRMGLSSTTSLNVGILPLMGADPLVANSALASMIALGFQDFYLFGVDCGRRRDQGHHAGDAIYYEEDYDNYLEGEGLELLENEFDRVVPGNFGGEVLTAWYLDMSRVSFSALLKRAQVKVVNCSNGAKIHGATPKAAAALKFNGQEGFKEQVKAVLDRSLRSYEKGDYLTHLHLPNLLESCDLFEKEFIKEIDMALADDGEFWDFHERMLALRNRFEVQGPGVLSIIRASFVSLIRVGAYGGTRIPVEEDRTKFLRLFIGLYRTKVLQMVDESRNLLRQMVDGEDVIKGVAGVGPD